jgi:hypothetical protein
MKIAVCTANFGGFDTVKQIPKQDIEFDRYYWDHTNSIYPMDGFNNRLKGKFYKALTHKVIPNYDVYIWLDGNVQVKSPSMIRTMAEGCKDILIQPHPFRKSITEEVKFIASEIEKGNKYLKSRYNPKSLFENLRYIDKDIKKLYACGIFARRNTGRINTAFDSWWHEICLFANFDQIEFVHMVDQFCLDVSTWNPGNFYSNEFFELVQHKKIG